MNKIIFPILTLTFSLFSFSQTSNDKPAFRVSLNNLNMTTYPKDSTANALVLYEYGNSYVSQQDYDLRTDIKRKVKIFNKDGFDNANITIYLYHSDNNRYEDVKEIIGTTYNLENGEVLTSKLDEKNIYREKYNENITMVKFTLPSIKEGSVIAYSYKLKSPYMRKYHGWNFQGEIPKLYSEYHSSIPANWVYNVKLMGGRKLVTNTSEIEKNCLSSNGGYADCAKFVYAMEDIPAFIDEDYMTTKMNYLTRIEYELETFKSMDGRVYNYTKTWEDVDKEIKSDKDIGQQLKKSVDLEDLLSADIINEKDLLKKAKAIYSYVQNNYKWNNDHKIFNDVSVKDLIKNKSGNVSSINILLNNLLNESNIDVNPVLLSTRENGFATKIYPVITDFDYLIVQATINNKTYLLDATDDFLNFGELPFRCLNQYGRLLDFKKGSKWIDIEPITPSNMFYQAELDIDDTNMISGHMDSKRTGYHALNAKKSYYKNSEAYVDQLENNYPNLEISDFEVTSDGRNSEDFKESYNIEYHYDNAGDRIYLNPFFIKFFKENPFKLQERTYPIDFGYKDAYFYIFKLKLNDNYTVTEIPEDLNLSLPEKAGQVFFSTKVIGNTVTLSFRISFNKAIYEPEFYPSLKEFMSKIVNIQTNTILVLQKK